MRPAREYGCIGFHAGANTRTAEPKSQLLGISKITCCRVHAKSTRQAATTTIGLVEAVHRLIEMGQLVPQ